MNRFRLHFEIGGLAQVPKIVEAQTPDDARKALLSRYAGSAIIIHKVKLDREGASA